MGGHRRAGEKGQRQEKRGQEAGAPRQQECNILLYFAIEMGQKGGNHYKKRREARVKATGSGSRRYGKRE